MNIFKLVGTLMINGVDKANEDIDKTTQNAGKAGEMFKKGITTVGKWGAAIAGGTATAAAGLVKFAESSASTSDTIDKMSQKIGISREAYQELDFICSQSGTSVDTLQMGIKSLTSAMDGAASGTASNVEEFEKLGVSVTDSSGNLRSQEDVMWETMSALQKMSNQTEKARLATELFGRSGTELMPLLNGASGSIEEMKNQAHELGLVIDDETIDSGVELTDTMDQMKRAVSAMVTKLGGSLMPILKKLCDYVIQNLPKIEGIFAKLEPAMTTLFDKLIPVLLELMDEILPVISDLINALIPVVSEIISNVMPLVVDIIEKIVPPMTQIIEAILPVLMDLLDILLPIIEGFLDVLSPILDVVVSLLQPILDLVSLALTPLKEAIQFLTGSVDDNTAQLSESARAARDQATAMLETKNAADQARQSIDDKAAAELSSLSVTQDMWKELQSLCDAQGNVNESDRERAEFLAGQLSSALGIEIDLTDGQIQNYRDLQSEIDSTIQKKQAEILLEASEEKYKLAIQNRTKAEEELMTATQNRTVALDELQALQEQGYTVNDKCYKDAMEKAAASQEAYADAKQNVSNYYNDIAQYESAQSAIMQGNTDEAIRLLDSQGQAFKTAADLANQSSEQQLSTLEQQLEDAAEKMAMQYDLLNGLSSDCTEAERKTYEEAFKKSKKYFSDAVTEYNKAGGTIGEEFFTSISGKMGVDRFKKIGSHIVDGIVQGSNGSKYSLVNTMTGLMNDALNAAQKAAKIHSPSKLFAQKVGAFIPSGIGMGIEDNEEDAISPLESMIDAMSNVGTPQISFDTAGRLPVSATIKGDMSSETSSIESKLDEVIAAIRALKLYIDGEVLVGAIAGDMNSALGRVQVSTERGM